MLLTLKFDRSLIYNNGWTNNNILDTYTINRLVTKNILNDKLYKIIIVVLYKYEISNMLVWDQSYQIHDT